MRRRPLFDQTNANYIDVSNESNARVILQRAFNLESDSEVVELHYDQNLPSSNREESNSLWLVSTSQKTRRSKILDLNNDDQLIWDLESEIEFQKQFDRPTHIPEEFHSSPQSQFSD